MTGKRVYRVFFDEERCRGYVKGPAAGSLENRWYGVRSGERLELSIEEIVYLLLRGDIVVVGDDVYEGFEDLLARYSRCFEKMFWPRLVVYKDLRDRGRRVRLAGDKFIVKHKDGSLRLVVVLQEKTLVDTSSFIELARQALSNNLNLVLAIVSFQGDLTYYEVSRIEPRKE